ncbi:MAG: hypothetical protein Q4E64_04305 [Phascolarctobacterium sp.]|uniref:hypothetical protein n=1 Tax=Phascolarctobacterium sp. TaxID=2049039 RepID=UPI0026DA74E3|nr:hypothetical protein [Phascolarctobacterium sp.]MDO4921035.1 hypothetical protein [Phascolarctobacterium sp.]
MSEQVLIAGSIGVLVLVTIFTKINILPKKYFSIWYNATFFAYVYFCFKYDYSHLLSKGMMVYGGIALFCGFVDWLRKK